MHTTHILARLFIAGTLILIMAGFATADALLIAETPWSTSTVQSNSVVTSSAGVIQKEQADTVETVAAQLNIQLTNGQVQSFLTQIITEEPVEEQVLLFSNDRLGTISWVESPRVKVYYTALKEALHQNFSPLVTDLADRTNSTTTGVTFNYLTFLDTGISEDRITFLRIRDRLYEFRTVVGKEQTMNQFIETLQQ